MRVVSRTTTFLMWKFYRTKVVPACVLVALLSILFGGALVVEGSLSEGQQRIDWTTGALNEVVVTNLLAASLLMLCHATYLALMAHHLVYRFPIERRQWVSLAYIAIVFAYITHARHTYLEATDQHGVLGAVWWSSAAFAVAYYAMAYHGIRERRAETGSAPRERQRPTQQVRSNWMLRTDLTISLLVTIMFVRATGLFNWKSPLSMVGIPSVAQVLRDLPLASALYAQASPKDALIAIALAAYVLARCVTQRRLRRDQTERQNKILAIQSIGPNGINWTAIRSFLPKNAVWLDLAGGPGKNVRELIGFLYKNDSAFPTEVIFLDDDCKALTAASNAWKEGWPAPTKQTYDNANMRSEKSRETLARCQVIHMGHAAYEPAVANAALHLLRFSKPGTWLLLRYTSNASFYRVISASTACAVLRPYIHHYTHQLLIEDLVSQGWQKRGDHILPRLCDISERENREYVIDWCDAQYGEFSGDVVERYLQGFAADGQTHVLNCDRLVLFEKVG
ncbi:MAG: hypothetical protein WB763_21930 [Terriglobia bacterium]|jgi:hypothetical protein